MAPCTVWPHGSPLSINVLQLSLVPFCLLLNTFYHLLLPGNCLPPEGSLRVLLSFLALLMPDHIHFDINVINCLKQGVLVLLYVVHLTVAKTPLKDFLK